MAAVQWNPLHDLPRDHVTERRGRAIDERRFGAHDNRCARFADLQQKIPNDRTADVHVQRFDDFRVKPGGCRPGQVGPGRHGWNAVVAVEIGQDRDRKAGFIVSDGDRGAPNDATRLVRDTPLQYCRRLRVRISGDARK